MLRVNLQFFGGRGGASGTGGGSSASESGNAYGNSGDNSIQQVHKAAVAQLSGSEYGDGTYDINTMQQVDYPSGYQVTFSQIGDNYSDSEYAEKVSEFMKVSSDGKVLAGKFEGTPEISFHTNSKSSAIKLAKKYNQISIWDWGNCDEIKTGGTGKRS